MEYEAVIGLEVHVQLNTRSKMFTRVPHAFGMPPNSLTDPVILGLPGALPVLNKEAIFKTIRLGLLCRSRIAERCKWDRKNYFYPDSPKNYQISQYDQPLCIGGAVEIEMPGPSRNVMGNHRDVRLTRIHLEEDVGKLTHFANDSLVDYNRAGTPLVEIVTEPDMHSADEVFAFLTALRNNIVCAGVSDCDMEKGQLRCDANISVRPSGASTLGTKVELKNMNTMSGVRNAVAHEIKRQIHTLKSGREIEHDTRRWDPATSRTSSMRTKEKAHDYRYFPDPDLMPVVLSDALIDKLREGLPELPFNRQRRYMEAYNLPYTLTSVLSPDAELCVYFEQTLKAAGEAVPPKAAANIIVNDLMRELAAGSADGESHMPLATCPVSPEALAELLLMIESGKITKQISKEVFAEMFASGKSAAAIVASRGLETQDADDGLAEIVAAVAADPVHEKAVREFRDGNTKAINSLIGPVMKATGGKADPAKVRELLLNSLTEG